MATKFGLLCSCIRVLKSSILFCFRISLISSGLRPASCRYDVFSDASFGRLFFVSLIRSLEIFRRGWSVSGYILAAPGIGLRNSEVPSGRAFLTSFLQAFSFMHSCCL